jgi:ketoreductase
MATRSARTIASLYGVTFEEGMDIMKSLSPQQRIIEPEEVAYLVSFLASDKAKGMTAQIIEISGVEPNFSGTRQRGI